VGSLTPDGGLAASAEVERRQPGAVARLWSALRRRLWVVDTELAARQRLRLLVGIPFTTIAGIAWGAFAAPVLDGNVVFWAAIGATSLSLFLYVQQRLIGPIGMLVNRRWPQAGGMAGFAWESMTVGALLLFVTRVLGAPLVPAVGTALGFGAFYVLFTEYLIHGGGDHLGMLLQGGAAGSGARRRDGFSYAESLVVRGRIDEAAEVYRDAIDDDPRWTTPYLQLSALWVKAGEPERACSVLREAWRHARLGEEDAGYVIRRLYSISTDAFGRPEEAQPEMVDFVERYPRSEHATWARWRLREMRGRES
jgi:hypothetical protein